MLLSRSPLASFRRRVPFDLHVLGAPPAFILSQDRTLRPIQRPARSGPIRPGCPSGRHDADRIHLIRVRSYWKVMWNRGAWRSSQTSLLRSSAWYTIAPRWVLVFPCISSQYPVLKVPACAAPPRGKELYCQNRAALGAGIGRSTFPPCPAGRARAGARPGRSRPAPGAGPRNPPCCKRSLQGDRGPIRAATRIARDRSRGAVFLRKRSGSICMRNRALGGPPTASPENARTSPPHMHVAAESS